MPSDAHAHLEAITAEHAELSAELERLRVTLAAHEAELNRTRRDGSDPERLTELAGRVSSLRLLVSDQARDLEDAAARLTAAGYAAQRATELERQRRAAAGVARQREAITKAIRELAPAVAGPVARIARALSAWGELYDEHADFVAELARIAAAEAGSEPPAAAVTDPAAWEHAALELEAAGIDPAAFADHPLGHEWLTNRARQGEQPARSPKLHEVELPELVSALTLEPEDRAPNRWGALDAPALAARIARAVLAGQLDQRAKPTT